MNIYSHHSSKITKIEQAPDNNISSQSCKNSDVKSNGKSVLYAFCFGLDKDDRKLLSTELSDIRCVFDKSRQRSEATIAFMRRYPRKVAYIKTDSADPQIEAELRLQNTPLIYASNSWILSELALHINYPLLEKFYPVIPFGEFKRQGTILFLSDHTDRLPALQLREPKASLAFYNPESDQSEKLEQFINEYPVNRVLIDENLVLPENIDSLISKYGLNIERVNPDKLETGKDIIQKLEETRKKERERHTLIFVDYPLAKQEKLALYLDQINIMFTGTQKPWEETCAYIKTYKPDAVFLLANRFNREKLEHISQFLENNKIPSIISESYNALQFIATNAQADMLNKFYPFIFYGKKWREKNNDFCGPLLFFGADINILPALARIKTDERLVFCDPAKVDADKLKHFFAYFKPDQIILDRNIDLSPEIYELLPVPPRSLKLEDGKDIFFQEIESQRESGIDALIFNLQENQLQAPALEQYRLWHLTQSPKPDDVRLFNDFSLILRGQNFTDEIRQIAAKAKAPLYLLSENPLSQLDLALPEPLFLSLEKEDFETKLLSCLNAPELTDAEYLNKAANFRVLYAQMREWIARRKASATDQKDFVLAIWENPVNWNELTDMLNLMADNEGGKKIILYIPEPMPDNLKLNSLARYALSCVITDRENLDVLLPQAKAVYTNTSAFAVGALLSGIKVVTAGSPWYAGWGLTEDLKPVQRPRKLDLDQFTLLAFFLASSYITPLTNELIDAEQALALWYIGQRPDYSHILAELLMPVAKKTAKDILDLRLYYYDNPQIDGQVAELLDTFEFGSLFADILMARVNSLNLARILEAISPDLALNLFETMLYALRYKINFYLLYDYMNKFCNWFKRAPIYGNDIIRFYSIYLVYIIREPFFYPPTPVFKQDGMDSDNYEENYKLYIKILIHCNEYYLVKKYLIKSGHKFSYKLYLDIMVNLFDEPSTVPKVKNLENLIYLRLLLLKLLLNISKNEFNQIPDPILIKFMVASLTENYNKILDLSFTINKLYYSDIDIDKIDLQSKELYINIFNIIEPRLRNLYNIHNKILNNIFNFNIPSKYRFGYINEGSWYQTYPQNMDKLIINYLDQINNTISYKLKTLYSYNYMRQKQYKESAELINLAPQPLHPKGIIFYLNFGPSFSTMLPLVLLRLRQLGYAVYPLYKNHFPQTISMREPFAEFAYAYPPATPQPVLDWTIDFANKKIAALGINFYDDFYEMVGIRLRKAIFDWEDIETQREFYRCLVDADGMLGWFYKLYRKGTAIPIALLSHTPYDIPMSTVRTFIHHMANPMYRFISYVFLSDTAATPDKFKKSVNVGAYDTALHKDSRVYVVPGKSSFYPWYNERKNLPEFKQKLSEIKQGLQPDLNCESEIIKLLKDYKNKGKRTICCVARYLMDKASDNDTGSGFDDMIEWLKYTCEPVAATPDTLLVIRPHPDETNIHVDFMSRQNIRSILPETLPDNIVVMNPRSCKITDMAPWLDITTIWLGTAQYELTALGYPVIICADNGRKAAPFNQLYPENKDEYKSMLYAREWPLPDAESREKALACLLYMSDKSRWYDYPYGMMVASNAFVVPSYFHEDKIQEFLANGDPEIDKLANAMIEGMVNIQNN